MCIACGMFACFGKSEPFRGLWEGIKSIHIPTYPPTHLLPTHSLTHSLAHITHTLHPLTNPRTHPPTHSPTHSLTYSPTYPPTHSLTHQVQAIFVEGDPRRGSDGGGCRVDGSRKGTGRPTSIAGCGGSNNTG